MENEISKHILELTKISKEKRTKENCFNMASLLHSIFLFDKQQASVIWNDIINNREVKYRNYYLVSIYRKLIEIAGIEDAVNMLIYDPTRIASSFHYAYKNTNLGLRAYEIIATLIKNKQYSIFDNVLCGLKEYSSNFELDVDHICEYIDNSICQGTACMYYREGLNNTGIARFYSALLKYFSNNNPFFEKLEINYWYYLQDKCDLREEAQRIIEKSIKANIRRKSLSAN